MHTAIFESYGSVIRVELSRSDLLPHIADRMPPGSSRLEDGNPDCTFSLTEESDDYVVRHDAEVVARADSFDVVLNAFRRRCKMFVAEMSPVFVFVHAGVVGWKGSALVFPGSSYTGKTTLVAELLGRGAAYLSDEYAVIDAQGLVRAYPQPLGVRDKSTAQTDRPAEHFGAVVGRDPLPVGVVVAAGFDQGANWDVSPISPGQAALELLEHTVSARRDPELAMSTLTAAVRGARAYKGMRGDAADAADRVLALADNECEAVR